jgi:hypothetical protein
MCSLTHLIHQSSAAAHEAAEIDASEKRRNGSNLSDDQRNEPEVAIEGAPVA